MANVNSDFHTTVPDTFTKSHVASLLRDLGLSCSGLKDELAARLQVAYLGFYPTSNNANPVSSSLKETNASFHGNDGIEKKVKELAQLFSQPKQALVNQCKDRELAHEGTKAELRRELVLNIMTNALEEMTTDDEVDSSGNKPDDDTQPDDATNNSSHDEQYGNTNKTTAANMTRPSLVGTQTDNHSRARRANNVEPNSQTTTHICPRHMNTIANGSPHLPHSTVEIISRHMSTSHIFLLLRKTINEQLQQCNNANEVEDFMENVQGELFRTLGEFQHKTGGRN